MKTLPEKKVSMNKYDRRSFLKRPSPWPPFLPLLPCRDVVYAADAAESNVVVGTWGGDYQRLLQHISIR